MSQTKQPVVVEFSPPHGSLRGYVAGFVASLVLTLLAYVIAVTDGNARHLVIGVTAFLAGLQCTVQLVAFLHLGKEFKPRWKLIVFGIMLSIVFILVVGSLWIMSNLNSRMMYSPKQAEQYVQGQDGL